MVRSLVIVAFIAFVFIPANHIWGKPQVQPGPPWIGTTPRQATRPTWYPPGRYCPRNSLFGLTPEENTVTSYFNESSGYYTHRFSRTFGRRDDFDQLKVYSTHSANFDSPKDITRELTYPEENYFITYVNLTIEQSSVMNRATIKSGGIGCQFITILMEANNTRHFKFDAFLYGR